MRYLLSALLLFTAFSISCAATGSTLIPLGVGTTPVFAYEEWVSSARVGDFVVRRYGYGTTERREVTKVGDVVIHVKITARSGDHPVRPYFVEYRCKRNDSADKKGLKAPELTQGEKTAELSIDGKNMTCKVFSGIEQVGTTQVKSGKPIELWRRIVRYAADDVPFGGTVKEMHPPLETFVMFAGQNEKDGRQVNNEEPTELAYEVIDYGRGKALDLK